MPQLTKIMSLEAAQFEATLQRMMLPITRGSDGCFNVAVDGGRVEIDLEPQPKVTLGGLLVLPRSRVTLAFHDLSDEQRKDFMDRFDVTFRRGGG